MQRSNVLALLVGVAVAGGTFWAVQRARSARTPAPPPVAVEPPPAGADRDSPPPRVLFPAAPGSFVDLTKRAAPAVVYISTQEIVTQPGGLTPFGFIPDQQEKRTGLGTGFIVEADGYILTNNHVVANADRIEVTLDDGRTFPARVVGTDPPTDLGLLKIDAPDRLPVLPLGDSARLQVGEWVIAIGNPFGLEKTVTAGIVSAKGRANQQIQGGGPNYQDFIQTDAAINPGNSGGPLIDMSGEVVGVNSAVNRDAQGIGFAIPIDMARAIVPLLKRDGHVERSALYIGIGPVTPDVARQLGLPRPEGAVVFDVDPRGPAAQAGLQPGDVITQLDGQDVDAGSLRFRVSLAGVGHAARLHVFHRHAFEDVTVTLARLE